MLHGVTVKLCMPAADIHGDGPVVLHPERKRKPTDELAAVQGAMASRPGPGTMVPAVLLGRVRAPIIRSGAKLRESTDTGIEWRFEMRRDAAL